MTTETIALIMTTLAGIAAAVKAIAEARKAKFESEARIVEAQRADEAEKTRDAVIEGVENAKKTLREANLAVYLEEEIRNSATSSGVEDELKKRVKEIRGTSRLSRDGLMKKLEGTGDGS